MRLITFLAPENLNITDQLAYHMGGKWKWQLAS